MLHDIFLGFGLADCPAMSFVFVCWQMKIQMQISCVGRSTTVGFPVPVRHTLSCTLLCYISLLSGLWNIDDRHQYPMSNNKDHLVGQLTTLCPAVTTNIFGNLPIVCGTSCVWLQCVPWQWTQSNVVINQTSKGLFEPLWNVGEETAFKPA